MTKKSVVMACTHPYWSALQVGSQHLARQFAKNGWQVHYVSAPVTPLHLPGFFNSANEVVKRFRCALKGPTIHAEYFTNFLLPAKGSALKESAGAIRSYIPFALMAPAGHSLLRDKIVTDHWHQTMIPAFSSLRKCVTSHGIDLLYIDNLSYHFLQDQLSYGTSIFRVMDLHEGFPGWEGKARQLAVKIAEKADFTIYSAQSLKNYVDSLKPQRSAFVPNGVDFELFRRTGRVQNGHCKHQRNLTTPRQNQGNSLEKGRKLKSRLKHTDKHPQLQCIPAPVILYTGMINDRVDFRLIRFAAQHLPNVSFVFTGAIQGAKSFKDLPKNVYFTGTVPHSELPWLMRDAVAGMIPFDVNNNMRLIQGVRPLKLLEYMAAGLPVIAACWPELEKMNSTVWFYNSEYSFIDLVSRAVDSQYDNSAAINYASQHDWDHSYKMMLREL